MHLTQITFSQEGSAGLRHRNTSPLTMDHTTLAMVLWLHTMMAARTLKE